MNVDDRYLEILHSKYLATDQLDAQELAHDFIRGCYPDITIELANEYLNKTRVLVEEEGLAYDCNNIDRPICA